MCSLSFSRTLCEIYHEEGFLLSAFIWGLCEVVYKHTSKYTLKRKMHYQINSIENIQLKYITLHFQGIINRFKGCKHAKENHEHASRF